MPNTPGGRSARSRPGGRLVALGGAAVVAIYTAGYARTQAAATGIQAAEAGTLRSVTEAAPRVAAVPPPSTQEPFWNTGDPFGGAPATPPAGANSATPPAATTSTTTATGYKDGTYVAIGTSRHGDVEVTVTVKKGRMVAADISRCSTRYPCSVIAALPDQAVALQSAQVDFVSGATDSSSAYREAVTAALAQAQ